MAGTTISGSYTTGIALTSAGSNPAAYVTGTIDVGSGVAFGASAASAWSVTNQGAIRSGSGLGVSIVSGVYLTNRASAVISGSSGIYIGNATGTVTNLGDIKGIGASGYGVRLSRGGNVINQSSGTISGYKAVPLRDGTVINAGVIQAVGTGAYGVGIFNGSVTNQGGGVISGGSSGSGVKLNFATMQNEGTINGAIGVYLQSYGGFANDGVIMGDTHAISLNGGGQITNQSTATIEGGTSGYAIAFTGGSGLVQNFGSIGGPAGAVSFAPNYTNLLIIDPGATFSGKVNGGNPIGSAKKSSILLGSGPGAGTFSGFGSTFVNFASIGVTIGSTWTIDTTLGSAYPVNNIGTLTNAGSIGSSINLSGVLTNASGATITSSRTAVHGYGTVVNAGDIAGKDGIYLFLAVDNAFTNLAGGVITGSSDAVYMRGTVDMLNAGSIAGGKHAVQFGSGYFDTLTVDPGASFSGLVDGGNPIGGSYVTTLVLASGASAGTITNLGSQYIDFGKISVGSGAHWSLAGQNTLIAGTTLTNNGTLAVLANAAFADAGVVENDGAIVLDPSTMALADLQGSGSATIGAASTLDAQGNVASGQTIVFTGVGGYLHLSAPASMAGTVTQFAVGQTIDLQGVAPASVTFSSGELNFAGGGFALGLASGGAVQVAASEDGAAITAVAQQVNGTTISGSYVAGITLTNPPGNPVYVTGTIDAASGVALGGSTGTVWTITNKGSIVSGDSSGISLASGGTISNEQAGAIGGYSGIYVAAATGSVTNVGAISGAGAQGFGVQLARGGSVSNQSGGTISGYKAVLIRSNTGGTVANAGSIGGVGAHAYGIGLSTGSVTNQSGGVITGGASGDGIKLGGGTIANDGAVSGGIGISAASYSTLTNNGGITGNTQAVVLAGGGVVTNQSGGTIAGGSGSYAIDITGGVADVTNDGSIGGGAGAIAFAPNYANLLVIDPGATFGGKVNGGNTIGAPSNSSLDLASGASAGTLSGLGSTFVNFAIISVASEASWTIDATIGTGYAIADSGTLTNTGSIGSGVIVAGVLTNASAATITSSGSAVSGSGTVVNAGDIAGADGVYLHLNATNSVTNLAGGIITGSNDGVYLRGTAELVNAGSIAGGANAVRFLAGYNDTLTMDPAAVFSGTVDGGNTIGATDVTTLVLASGATAGTITGLGSQYIDFGQITIGDGAAWDVAGQNTLAAGTTLTNSGSLTVSANASFADAGTIVNDGSILLDPSTLQVADLIGNGSATIGAASTLDAQASVASGQTIMFGGAGAYLHLDVPASMAGRVTQFAIGETIDLKGVDPSSVTLSSGQLHFTGGSFSLALTGAAGKVVAVASSDGAAVTAAPCFRAGTRIATERGDVPVERLAIGDRLRTLIGGGLAPVVWIGQRRIDCARHNRPRAVWPVRVAAGAFGKGRPHRALWLSPDHAVFLDNVLVPVRYLINGTSIVQVSVPEVSYFHIELPRHDVLLAEGLPAESYLDTGDRSQFSNGGNVVALHPEFVARNWEAVGCAPLIVSGPKLAAIKQRMRESGRSRRGMRALA